MIVDSGPNAIDTPPAAGHRPADVHVYLDAGASASPGDGAAVPDTVTVEPVDRDALIERYAPLVKYVVGRLGVSVHGVFDHEDAMQAGTLGLLRAIDAYRVDAASSFESYAIVRIRGAILDAV